MLKRLLHKSNETLLIALVLIFISTISINCNVYAQTNRDKSLPLPNSILKANGDYKHATLLGVKIDKNNGNSLQFIVDAGDDTELSSNEFRTIIDYFFAALALPSSTYWVNLSPYEPDRIIDKTMESTQLGKDLILQDYYLKQRVASLTHPDTKIGKSYWKENIADNSAYEKYWIVPGAAEITEDETGIYISYANLDVLSETDYNAYVSTGDVTPNLTASESSKTICSIMKDEVNSSEDFSEIRQIYDAMILAKRFKERFLNGYYSTYINESNIHGIEMDNKKHKDDVYELYTDSFSSGVYNLKRRLNIDGAARNYRLISGGASMRNIDTKVDLHGMENLIDKSMLKVSTKTHSSSIDVVTGKEEFWQKVVNKEQTYPNQVEIHLGPRCNHKCKYCYHLENLSYFEVAQALGKQSLLNPAEISLLAQDLSDLRTESLVLSGGFEPFASRHIYHALSEFSRNNLGFHIITNASLINKDKVSTLLGAERIRVSMDSLNPEIYKEIRRDDLSKALDNLRAIVKARELSQTSNLDLGIAVLVLPENIDDLENTLRMASDLGVDNIIFKYDYTDSENDLDFSYRVNKTIRELEAKYGSEIAGMQIEYFNNDVDENTGKSKRCYASFRKPVIDPYGNVYPCCAWAEPNSVTRSKVLGNLRDFQTSFRKLWESVGEQLRSIEAEKCAFCMPNDNLKNHQVEKWVKSVKSNLKQSSSIDVGGADLKSINISSHSFTSTSEIDISESVIDYSKGLFYKIVEVENHIFQEN